MPKNELTFAQAMALDPSEVEVMCKGGSFVLLSDDPMHWTLTYLRHARYRRAKPKRSRVQEQHAGDPRAIFAAELSIRAVCEWLRTNPNGSESLDGTRALEIEHEFLVPR